MSTSHTLNPPVRRTRLRSGCSGQSIRGACNFSSQAALRLSLSLCCTAVGGIGDSAGLAELADAAHSKCVVERRAGSSPASGTDWNGPGSPTKLWGVGAFCVEGTHYLPPAHLPALWPRTHARRPCSPGSRSQLSCPEHTSAPLTSGRCWDPRPLMPDAAWAFQADAFRARYGPGQEPLRRVAHAPPRAHAPVGLLSHPRDTSCAHGTRSSLHMLAGRLSSGAVRASDPPTNREYVVRQHSLTSAPRHPHARVPAQARASARARCREIGMCPIASTTAAAQIQKAPRKSPVDRKATTGSTAIGTGTPHTRPNSANGVRCRAYLAHSSQYPSTATPSTTPQPTAILPGAVHTGTATHSACPSRSVQESGADTLTLGTGGRGGNTRSSRFGSIMLTLTARPSQEKPMTGRYQAGRADR